MVIEDIVKVYVSKNGLRSPALNGFSAQLPDKGLVFILGKSGCGKSTLLPGKQYRVYFSELQFVRSAQRI